jgi:hypothetical protein
VGPGSAIGGVVMGRVGPVCDGVAVTVAVTLPPSPLIRGNGRIVRTCPGLVVFCGDVPGMSSFVGSWPQPWQQFWQQSTSEREPRDRLALAWP